MRAVSVTEIARNFSEYLNRVAFRGEHFVLTRGNKEIAELRPVRRSISLRDFSDVLAFAPGLTATGARAFERDIQQARRAAAAVPVRDVWSE